MNKEESLQFVQERLRRQHGSALDREVHLRPRQRVTRRVAMEMASGSTEVFDCVDDTVKVHCASGSVWITHDGDPRDVILVARECYCADTDRTMRVSALQACVLEIEFEDEVTLN